MADPQPKKSEGMAESVTPQPKELEDWYAWDRNDRSMDHEELFELACDLGDALAVLVPQLLDQLAAETKAANDAIAEADYYQDKAIANGFESVALSTEVERLQGSLASALDQRAQETRRADWHAESTPWWIARGDRLEAERDALGERVHQLEGALRTIHEAIDRPGPNYAHHVATANTVRDRWPTLWHAIEDSRRAALGDPKETDG